MQCIKQRQKSILVLEETVRILKVYQLFLSKMSVFNTTLWITDIQTIFFLKSEGYSYYLYLPIYVGGKTWVYGSVK